VEIIDDKEGKYLLVRGPWLSEYFCFFVDDTSSCWSKKISGARRYATKEEAKKDYFELRQRAKQRAGEREATRKGGGR